MQHNLIQYGMVREVFTIPTENWYTKHGILAGTGTVYMASAGARLTILGGDATQLDMGNRWQAFRKL